MKKNLPLTLATVFYFLNLLNAQTLDRSFVTTNGAVRAILKHGDTVYLGGDFTQLGIQSKGIARFNPGSTKPDSSFPQSGTNDSVNAIEPDGNGGFYLAGNFMNFNGMPVTSSRILHVLNDGSLDAAFNAVTADSAVLCMKKSGSLLYIGGAFTNIQNTNQPYLAALNTTSGALDSWSPATPDNSVKKIDISDTKMFIQGDSITSIGGYITPTHFAALRLSDGAYLSNFPSVNNSITSLAVSGDTLYLGGTFNQAGPSAYGVAKLSAADGTVDEDFPSTNGVVQAVFPDGIGGYYIGGSFTKVANKSRLNLAHILSDGSVDAVFNVNVNSEVACITADADNLYFGGYFSAVNGTGRNYVAAVTKTDGALTTWNPNPDSIVLTITRLNNIIYLGGWFTNIQSTARNYAAAVTAAGNLNSWSPQPDYYVNQIIANVKGTSLFLCGGFTKVKNSAHEYITKVNATNGAAAAWRPKPDNVVKSIALSGSTIYMAGFFSFVNGRPRQFLAAVDTVRNNPTSFRADLNNYPNYLSIAAGKLYVAGNFSQVQNENISYLSRIDLSSGNVDAWNPVSNAYTGVVYSNGTDVIAGGNFTIMNGLQKNFMASVNLNANKFTGWTAGGVAAFNVNSIDKILPVGADIFIGGNFNYYDGFNTVNNILMIDNSLGNISHTFKQYPLNTVSQLSIYDDELMIGGSFSNIYDLNTGSSSTRKNIAAYNQPDYTLSDDVYDANNSLNGMFTDAAGNLIISGNFSLLNYVKRNYLAAISLQSKQVLAFNPSPTSTVYGLALKDSSLFVGGAFKNIGGKAKSFMASVNKNTGVANTWSADCDSTVYALAVQNTTLYFGGLFTQVKGASRSHAAAASTAGNGVLKSWMPQPDNAVNAINAAGNIYLGGNFNKLKITPRNYLAKVNSNNGSLLSWNPDPNNSILSFAANDSTFFIGGNQFSSISGKPRNALTAYTISDNKITAFNPKLKYNNAAPQVNALAINGNTLYIGTSALNTLNGASRGSLAAADITNSSALAFNPAPDSAVLALSADDGYLLAGGLWNSLGTNVSPSYFAVFKLQAQNLKSHDLVLSNDKKDNHIFTSGSCLSKSCKRFCNDRFSKGYY